MAHSEKFSIIVKIRGGPDVIKSGTPKEHLPIVKHYDFKTSLVLEYMDGGFVTIPADSIAFIDIRKEIPKKLNQTK